MESYCFAEILEPQFADLWEIYKLNVFRPWKIKTIPIFWKSFMVSMGCQECYLLRFLTESFVELPPGTKKKMQGFAGIPRQPGMLHLDFQAPMTSQS